MLLGESGTGKELVAQGIHMDANGQGMDALREVGRAHLETHPGLLQAHGQALGLFQALQRQAGYGLPGFALLLVEVQFGGAGVQRPPCIRSMPLLMSPHSCNCTGSRMATRC